VKRVAALGDAGGGDVAAEVATLVARRRQDVVEVSFTSVTFTSIVARGVGTEASAVTLVVENSACASSAAACIGASGMSINGVVLDTHFVNFQRTAVRATDGAHLTFSGNNTFIGAFNGTGAPPQWLTAFDIQSNDTTVVVTASGNGAPLVAQSYWGLKFGTTQAAAGGQAVVQGIVVRDVWRAVSGEYYYLFYAYNSTLATMQNTMATWVIKCDRGCLLSVQSSVVTKSERGIYVSGGQQADSLVYVNNSIFTNLGNERLFCGAGVYCGGGHQVIISDRSAFTDNKAKSSADACCQRFCRLTADKTVQFSSPGGAETCKQQQQQQQQQ